MYCTVDDLMRSHASSTHYVNAGGIIKLPKVFYLTEIST